jgi:hypothetical protein
MSNIEEIPKENMSVREKKLKEDIIKLIEGAKLPIAMIRYGLREISEAVEREYLKDLKKGELKDGEA